MSGPRRVADDIFSQIADMEAGVRDLARWASILGHLSASPHLIEHEMIGVLARVMTDLGREVERDWEKLFAMSSGRPA